jgi:hypothetical protein
MGFSLSPESRPQNHASSQAQAWVTNFRRKKAVYSYRGMAVLHPQDQPGQKRLRAAGFSSTSLTIRFEEMVSRCWPP